MRGLRLLDAPSGRLRRTTATRAYRFLAAALPSDLDLTDHPSGA